jgi:hypothetical protein
MTDDELDQRLRESILSEEIDASRVAAAVRNQIRRRRQIPRWALVAAAAAIIALTAFLWPRSVPPLCAAAAQDHEREIVKNEPRRWLADLPAIESLAEKQGVPASAIAALGTTGYQLERGRLCFLNKRIFLHLVYTKNGDELSVYLRPRGSDSPYGGSVRQASIGPYNLAYFQTSRLTAVFIDEWRGQAATFALAGARVL